MIIGTYSGTTYERVEQPKPHKKVDQSVSTKPLCNRCELAPAHAKGQCVACLKYKRVFGIERPYRLIERARERRTKPLWCKVCKSPKLYQMRRCAACYKHWRKTGKERPEWRWNPDVCCSNCGYPKSAAPLSKHGHRRFWVGRCEPCHHYLRDFKRERPQHLWGIGKAGWCECGYPAEHQIDGFNLCNRCVEEFR